MRDWHGDVRLAFRDNHLVGLVTHNGHRLPLEPANQVFVHWNWVHHRPVDFGVFGRDRWGIDLGTGGIKSSWAHLKIFHVRKAVVVTVELIGGG